MSWEEVRQNEQRPVWFIAASGPSLTREDCDLIPREYGIIGINNSWEMVPDANILYACDRAWWDYYQPEFKGIRLSYASTATTIQVPATTADARLHPDKISTGGNGGHQAIGVAHLLGARLIVLLGYDMKGSHWHGEHGGKLVKTRNFKRWIRNMQVLANGLEAKGIRVINATRDTALECFERMTIDQAIDIVRGSDLRGQGVLHPQPRRGASVAG